MMGCVQMMCARVGMVSGMGLAGAMREKFPRWVVGVISLALVIGEHHQRRLGSLGPGRCGSDAGSRSVEALRVRVLKNRAKGNRTILLLCYRCGRPRGEWIMSEHHEPIQNHLLNALAPARRERLYPHLDLVEMPLGKVLYESGDLLRHVYFPTDAIVSLLYVMEDGASAEIAVVGNERLIGVALFMGGETTTNRAIVQSAGFACRLAGQRFKDEFHRNGQMQILLLRYTQALLTQMAQTAVCNRHHSVDQQLCRWLLLSIEDFSPEATKPCGTVKPICSTAK
jgi:CRP-like cAMP-binding protein